MNVYEKISFNFSSRSHASSIRINESTIWVTGGLGGSGTLSSTEILHAGSTFKEGTELPEPMAYHCSAQINSTHLVLAGNVYGDHMQAYIVDTSRNPFTFTKLPNMLKPRWGCACTIIHQPTTIHHDDGFYENGVQIMVGGGDFPFYSSTDVYSFESGSWEEGPKLPRGFYLGGYTQNSYTDDFILIGGWDGSSYPTNLLKYNQYENNFDVLDTSLSIGRSRFGTIIVDKDDYCS